MSQGGALSSDSHNNAYGTSYCQQQVAQTIQNQQVVLRDYYGISTVCVYDIIIL